ncbi:MAG TPA: hypothetical protein DCM10_12235 [Xanthomarina gelatinilytica]|nr:hypothetical protein [Xanthomarina gelatinilytica]|tara:strand:+ start:3952 stop:4548 length:597 start_codon:yes stop_codon:yes gene_type:complete
MTSPSYVTKKQLAESLLKAGFSPQELPTMIEIARRESGLNRLALNPNANTGDLSYGAFQINMLGDMGPERRKQFGIEKNEQLYDLDTNTRAAKIIKDQQGFGAWSVYNPTDPAFTGVNLDDTTVKQTGDTYNITVEAKKEKARNPEKEFEQLMLGQLLNNSLKSTPPSHGFSKLLQTLTDQSKRDAARLMQSYDTFYP